MSFHSSTFTSTEIDSEAVGLAAARSIKGAFLEQPLRVVIAYAGIQHDQGAILRALRAELGSEVLILGCSVQGIAASGRVHEDGYLLGVMGLGGESLKVAAVLEREIQSDSRAKGQALGRGVKAALGEEPKVMILLYDPLCHADVEQLLSGLSAEVSCPLVGGGASQPFGPIARTYQYWQDEVVGKGAIALGLAGPFSFELGLCHGSSPTGLDMTVTRSDGNRLLEIDGRAAVEAWCEVTGCTDDQLNNQDQLANWAIGIQRTVPLPSGGTEALYFVRATFGVDIDHGAFFLQAAIAEGTKIMVHHRTTEAVLEGTVAMGRDLSTRLEQRRPWAVLGFECGARTSPFLGESDTLKENLALQNAVAPEAPWLGMMAWGEIAPVGGDAAFHNYTYPLLVLAI